jgi:hypothetical protein
MGVIRQRRVGGKGEEGAEGGAEEGFREEKTQQIKCW